MLCQTNNLAQTTVRSLQIQCWLVIYVQLCASLDTKICFRLLEFCKQAYVPQCTQGWPSYLTFSTGLNPYRSGVVTPVGLIT